MGKSSSQRLKSLESTAATDRAPGKVSENLAAAPGRSRGGMNFESSPEIPPGSILRGFWVLGPLSPGFGSGRAPGGIRGSGIGIPEGRERLEVESAGSEEGFPGIESRSRTAEGEDGFGNGVFTGFGLLSGGLPG